MNKKSKLRVGVLMGGRSIEKEVSFNSGRTICDHLDTQRYTIVPIFQKHNGDLFLLPWHFLYRGKISDFEHRLEKEAKKVRWDDLKEQIDFMYLALHGQLAEDGTTQGFLEILNIPYLGSKVFASALTMDKIMQKNILRSHNIHVPKGIHVKAHEINTLEQHKKTIAQRLQDIDLQPPYIVKPNNQGSSLGVEVANNEEQLHAALQRACNIVPGKQQVVLIEEKIEGMEFSCSTITDYKIGDIIPLPPTEVVIEDGTEIHDYKQKYMPGRGTEFTPARCTQEQLNIIKETCKKAAIILGIQNISRTDGFLTKNGNVVIVESNPLTGMSPTSFLFREAAQIGMSHTKLINHLIETELHQYDMLADVIEQEEKEAKAMHNKKIRVAVLLGGNTNEREISLESGRNVVYKLSPQKYEAIPVFVSSKMELFIITQEQLVLNSTKEIEQSLHKKTNLGWHDLPTIADFVFIGLHGGHGENGSVQGALEMLDLPYNGSSVLASALCMDKFKTCQYLKQQGFQVPSSLLIDKKKWKLNKQELINSILNTIPFPIIIKPHDDGCSVMVQKIDSKKQLETTIDLFFTSEKKQVMVEECINGMELTVGVIGNEKATALPPSQAVATQGILSIEEKFLPGAGENQTPAPLPAKTLKLVQQTMEQVYETVGCAGYVRIDCFYQQKHESPTGKERVVILEINSLPGMTPATCIFHQAAEIGMKPMDFIDLVVTLGIEKHTSLEIKAEKKPLNKSKKNQEKATYCP